MNLKQLLFLKAATGKPQVTSLLDVTQYSKIVGISSDNLTSNSIHDDSVGSGSSDYIMFSQEFEAGTYAFSCKAEGEGISGVRLLSSVELPGWAYVGYYGAYYKDLSGTEAEITTTEAFYLGMVLKTGTATKSCDITDILLTKG